MCGIAGWFSTTIPRENVLSDLNNMADSLSHRGPDDSGLQLLGNSAFSHRRLSILDLENAKQPMLSLDGQVQLTYNGEIYNFLHLMQALKKSGAYFKTRSDTEVILQLYLKEGVVGFKKLRGMFAFAIWDNRIKRGYLIRDSIGIKPLFYCCGKKGELLFASEAKAILARDKRKAQLNESALHLVMNFRYIPDQQSMFRGIEQLPAGHMLCWQESGAMEMSRYHFDEDSSNSDDQIHNASLLNDNVLNALQESVRSHLIADVEVGAYLSGGVDSASVVALAGSALKHEIRTFTVDAGDDPNEANNAARTATLLGVENLQQQLALSADQLKKIVWHLEVPKINALQIEAVASHASRYVKVALSGLGGDELFLGYNAHKLMTYVNTFQQYTPSLISVVAKRLSPLIATIKTEPWSELERIVLMASQRGDWSKIYGLMRNVWDAPQLREKIYGPRMLDQSLPNAFGFIEEHWQHHKDPLISMRNFEWQHKMVNDLLWQEDRCSMAVGLEVRVPFVDKVLQQQVWHLDRQQLMPDGQLKGLMREAVSSILPLEILNRPKSGFQVNSPQFFQQQLSGLADRYLSDEVIKKYQLFNPIFVKEVRALSRNIRYRWHFFMLYLMICTHLWMELFEDEFTERV